MFLCIFKENHLLEDRELAILPLFFLLAEVGERVQFLLIAFLVPASMFFVTTKCVELTLCLFLTRSDAAQVKLCMLHRVYHKTTSSKMNIVQPTKPRVQSEGIQKDFYFNKV